MRSKSRLLCAIVALIVVAFPLLAADTGRITGTVKRSSGEGVPGVVVVINERSSATLTDANGAFSFTGVPVGTYSLSFSVGEHVATQESVQVTTGSTTTVDKTVDWRLSFADTITVYSASRRSERIVEAPAAVTVVAEETLQAESASGQLPKVLESAPGVDFTQSGLYDFNFNTRGFNSSLNRRILTLVDGRDPAIAFLGAQEWAALSYPIDEMANVELVRGPGSALYGANAFNGVLNMVTKQPKATPGGKFQVSGGDLSTGRADLRQAGQIGGGWHYRVVGGYQESEDFTRSRNAGVEYPGLPAEVVPLPLTDNQIAFGGLRLDHNFEGGQLFTLEGGYSTLEGPTFQTGIGRVQVTDVERPWARLNFNTRHWNISTYYDARDADRQIALGSGAALYEDSYNVNGEVQGNVDFFGGRARIVGGGAYRQQNVDTSNPAGQHTLMAEAKDEEFYAGFAQLDLDMLDNLKLVLAGRYDDGTLHDGQFSPKASLVYEFMPSQTVRATYNRAFQVPNYSEFFLRAPARAPINLAAIENAVRPLLGGISLGFGTPVPFLALGNENLDVEKITGYELGYAGIFGGKAFVTIDYYKNNVEDFVTDLLPRVNPLYPAYAPPAGLSAQARATVLGALQANLPAAAFLAMTNINGAPAFVVSYTNAGEVDTQGVEFAINYYLTDTWIADFNYSWFDFDVQSQQLGDQLLPNAPEHKYNVGLTYRRPSFDLSVKYRWVDEFPWAAGIFQGVVPEYDVVNLSGSYTFAERFTIGASVSNALDNEHYETFGGDILQRRALGYMAVRW